MLARFAQCSKLLRPPHLVRANSLAATAAGARSQLHKRFAHEMAGDFRNLEFQLKAREADELTQELRAREEEAELEAMLAFIREIAEESSNSIASMSDEEIKAENQLILKEHCARYAEPPIDYYLDTFAEELDQIEDDMPPPEFDEELKRDVADEPYPEAAEHILTNSAWMEHRETNITNTEDLRALLDKAESALADPTQRQSLSRQDYRFYKWLCTIAEASEERWKGCFETITVVHAPEALKRHFSRKGLEHVFRNPVRREMSLSLAERYSTWAVEADEHVHRFSTWPKF